MEQLVLVNERLNTIITNQTINELHISVQPSSSKHILTKLE